MPEVSWEPVGHPLVPVAVTALLVALLLLRPHGQRCSARRRWILAGLRLLVILVVLLLLLRPAVVYRTTQRRTATVLVGVDVSRSMLVADQGTRSRWQHLLELFQQHQGELARLREQLELHFFTLGGPPRQLEWAGGGLQLPETPEDQESAYGWCLDQQLRRHSGKRLAAVVLLGDGNARARPDHQLPMPAVARRLAQQQVPLYTVTFGRSEAAEQLRDVRIEQLLAPDVVYVKNELVVQVQLRVVGLAHKEIPLRLLFETPQGKMEVVDSVTLQAAGEEALLTARLHHTPQQPGTFKLTVQAEPQPGELVTVNNQQSSFVRVSEGGINVLYLEGTYRPEQKFVRRALAPSPNVQLETLRVPLLPPKRRPDRITQLFQQAFEPGKYDVYIFGDLDSTVFRREELDELRRAIAQGAGFLMLGGVHSFGPGGWFDTPLAEVLPVEMSPLERQNPGEPIRRDVHLPGPVKLRPTREGLRSFLALSADPQENLRLWRQLPPLVDGANRFRGVKSGVVLLESQQGEPVLVAGNFGTGRVLAFAADTTWRWALSGFRQQHARLWRQMILWLARREELDARGVWIRVEPRRAGVGQEVTITAGAHNEQGEAVPDARFTARLVPPEGEPRPLELRRRGEQMQAQLSGLEAPGDYRVQVQATSAGGESLGQATARFLVYRRDLELENPVADFPAMHRWASLTPEGKALAAQEFSQLIALLEAIPSQLEIEVTTRLELWDHWLVMVLFVTLLSVEWYLRKRWGLV